MTTTRATRVRSEAAQEAWARRRSEREMRKLEALGNRPRNEREEALWQENLDQSNKTAAKVDNDELDSLLSELGF